MEFTNLQKQIIMYIHEHPATEEEITARFPELGEKYEPSWYAVIDPILNAKLIDTGAPGDPAAVWTLTNSGIVIVEAEQKATAERKKETRRFWIPVAISIIALLISACSLYVAICK